MLFQDMLPDARWEKREKEAFGGVRLPLLRARQLHAAISIRNYGIWSLILTAYGMATKLNDKGNLKFSLGFSIVTVVLFCIYLTVSFLDSTRNRDVNSWFRVSVPTLRHLLEAIAIPAFFIGFIGFAILVISLKAFEIEPSSPFYEPFVWIVWTITYTPWMAVTALVMAVGAWLRWRDGGGGVVENSAAGMRESIS
jgi:hypothetical protein